MFPGGRYSRGDTYRAIIAEPHAPDADKAYAPLRAIRCYAPSGYSACGGTEVPSLQRKAWFLRLKKEYPQSRWAGEAKLW